MKLTCSRHGESCLLYMFVSVIKEHHAADMFSSFIFKLLAAIVTLLAVSGEGWHSQ